jgi:hypothetical protein
MDMLSPETQQRIFRTLGEGVVRVWSGLPQEIQQELFEAAVQAEGEVVRSQLAVFLHGTHTRTTDGHKARAVPEPDSKGG